MAALLAPPRRRRRRVASRVAVQQPLDFRPPGHRRGGARPNAGRPRITGRRSNVPHTRRAALPRHRRGVPLVVTFRVVRAVGSLRRRAGYQAMRHALVVAARRVGNFRVVQLSIQRDHVHLIVEALDTGALSRGMRAPEIAFHGPPRRPVLVRRDLRRLGRPAHVAGEPWPVSAAQTWLLTTGWRRRGRIATTEVPG